MPNDPDNSTDQLIEQMRPGTEWLLSRKLGTRDAAQTADNCLMDALQAIRKGDLHDPENLPRFTLRIINNYARSRGVGTQSNTMDDEGRADCSELARIGFMVLEKMSERDREILRRYYVLRESEMHICQEMPLTEMEFSIVKDDARRAFVEEYRKTPGSQRKPSRMETNDVPRKAIA